MLLYTPETVYQLDRAAVDVDGFSEAELMRRAGEWVPADIARKSWAVPMSMRDVDAECRASITDRYAVERGTTEGAS